METFTPIAMKCTKEQFNAIKPKLRGLKIEDISSFYDYNYLVNNYGEVSKRISNVAYRSMFNFNREIHEEWNEEIFLKACGIEVETLQEKEQRLLKELEEVREEIEDSEIKDGDWVYCSFGNYIFKYTHGIIISDFKKITNPELIKLLEQELNGRNTYSKQN